MGPVPMATSLWGQSMAIKIALVDDHRMFREALREQLQLEDDMEIVAEASSGAETLDRMEEAHPHILIIDITMGDMNGIEVVRRISKRYPAIRAIALSGHAERIYVEEMLKAGAKGYVVKTCGTRELVSAIRAVHAGNTFLSPEVTQLLMRRMWDEGGDTAQVPPPNVLGNREQEVLRLLASGRRSAEIAQRLNIAVATVEVHRRNIKHKLGLHSVAELTGYAIKEGLIAS